MATRRMFRFLGMWLFLSVLVARPAVAENFQRGQELFEHHCHGCHGDLRMASKEGKVKTLSELRDRIISWSIHSGSDWSDSEVDDVLYYMNKSFYHINSKQQ